MANKDTSQYQQAQGASPSNDPAELLLGILRRISKEVEAPALQGDALKVAEFYKGLVAQLAPGTVDPDRRLFGVVDDLFTGVGPAGFPTTQQKSGS
jgi:hypothetical protein